ncbi:hypothetical protein M513_09272 [Trichuris suis]|uniref:Uncharacterized protein n=1 Tax=Trichuris suis TaxID=68888 RepID=A0A085LXV9_9BILA|nr:hypothetical protein M513_09272 [Trichuris suis]
MDSGQTVKDKHILTKRPINVQLDGRQVVTPAVSVELTKCQVERGVKLIKVPRLRNEAPVRADGNSRLVILVQVHVHPVRVEDLLVPEICSLPRRGGLVKGVLQEKVDWQKETKRTKGKNENRAQRGTAA